MSLKSKSKRNIGAASLLIREGFYSTSIHCSYYSVFQLMLWIENTIGPEAARPQKEDRKKKEGSHQILIHFFMAEISKILGYGKSKNFGDRIYRLKRKRIQADYKSRRFSKKEAYRSKSDALNLQKLLMDYLLAERRRR